MRAIAAFGLAISIGAFVHSIAGATQRSMIEQIQQQEQQKDGQQSSNNYTEKKSQNE